MLEVKREEVEREGERGREIKRGTKRKEGWQSRKKRTHVLSHGEVGGRNTEWWESQKKKKEVRKQWEELERKRMERKVHREGVKHTQPNNKQKGQNARVQQQINTEPWREVTAPCP